MDLSLLKVAKYDGQRIWLVRCDSGRYYEHFRQAGIISIGHLDAFYDHRAEVHKKIPSGEEIRKRIIANAKFSKPKTNTPILNNVGTKHHKQILHFLNDIRKGDIIVTLNNAKVLIGVCRDSKAFFRSRPVRLDDQKPDDKVTQLNHRLRKSVDWGPELSRTAAAVLLKKPLQSRQTIVSLKQYWKDVYSLLYPFFVSGDELHFSTTISRRGPINGKAISKFIDNVADAEILFDRLLHARLDPNSLDELVQASMDWDSYHLTTKAHFGSPGAVYSSVPIPTNVRRDLAIRGLALMLLLCAGQISAAEIAEQLDPIGGVVDIYTPSGMVNERTFKSEGSKNLDRLLGQLAEQNKGELNELQKKLSADKVGEYLRIGVPKNKTDDLEKEAGIQYLRVGADEK